MIQIGSATFVRHEDIVRLAALSDISEMSEIKCGLANGTVIAITGRSHCTAVFLRDGKIFISPVSAKTIKSRIQAADWSNSLTNHTIQN